MTPVTVTRGSETGFSSQRIDWIEGTFKGRTPVDLPPILSQNYVECRAYNGYTVGSKYDDGRTLFQNPSRPEMGKHLTWSGDACGLCPIDPLDLVKHLINAKFSFTRLDLAIDLINCNLEPSEATEEIANGRCKTRAKEFPYWADANNKGYTQYIGKKASEIYCRIYDKAAEMGVQSDHTRVELVIRHERADKAAREIVRNPDYRRVVAAFVEFPSWDAWNFAMAVSAAKLPAERKTSGTKLWLLRSCSSALAKTMILDGDAKFLFQFLEAVELSFIQMSNNIHTVH